MIVVLEIVACLILAALVGGLTGWFLQRLKAEPTRRAAERLLVSLEEAEGNLLDVKAESRIHAARAEKLETEIRSRAITAQTLENEISSLRARLSTADKALEASGRERDEVARELEEVREQLNGASAQIEEARLKLAEQERSAEHLQQTIEELKQAQAISIATLGEKVREIDKLHADLAEESSRRHTAMMERADELAAFQERTEALEAELAQGRTMRERMEEEARIYRKALEERERELDLLRYSTGAHVLQDPAVAEAGMGSGDNGAGPAGDDEVSRSEPADDLKLIPGIGPKLEQVLHGLGVRTFRQVALWSDEEIERVDAQLERFRGRIRRDRWVESAREEFKRKYGTRLGKR